MFKNFNNKKRHNKHTENKENKPRGIEKIKNKFFLFENMTKLTNPTEKELSDVELALQKLWKLDKNRLNPDVDVCNYVNHK